MEAQERAHSLLLPILLDAHASATNTEECKACSTKKTDALVGLLAAKEPSEALHLITSFERNDFNQFNIKACPECSVGTLHGGASSTVDRERDVRRQLSCALGKLLYKEQQNSKELGQKAINAAANYKYTGEGNGAYNNGRYNGGKRKTTRKNQYKKRKTLKRK